ncbi:MAG TPA: hydroxymethylpyrimidine/phosphomethylpyrimidine kinase [Kofleriaceae bacterium]|nr:hydroxymethylpyrimidine/phosphomethylpyrimidine kinase [Kofleriaceae bacterium]
MTAYRDAAGPPGLLICAGLDPSGGAGLIADVQVAAQLGTRPVGVVTALTVQNTTGVVGSQALGPEMIREQLELLLSDVEVRAVKIGMIGSSEVAAAIGEALALTRAPVVWDPITYPSRGDVPLVDSLFGRALQALKPHLTVLTPNARELAFLTQREELTARGPAVLAARELARQLDAAVLVKAGHLAETDAHDVLCTADGITVIEGKRLERGEDVHGTGCALSTAIAAHLARGAELADACREAKAYVATRIAAPARPGRGAGSIV